MKKWAVRILMIAFILSIGLNMHYKKVQRNETSDLLARYKSELLRCSAAFNSVIDDKNKRGPLINRSTASETAAVALEVSVILGKHDVVYSLNQQGKVYQAIPYEMTSLLLISLTKNNKDIDQNVNDVLHVYAEVLKATNVADPDALRIAYTEIRQKISGSELLKSGINFPELGY